MALEVEVKVARDAPADDVDAELRSAGARLVAGPELEDDRLFDTAGGRLREADRVLRLRRRGGRAWLTLKGPSRPDGDLKVRQEHETEVVDAEALERVLAGLGLEPVVRYQKVRSRYHLDGVTICLDRTPAGRFLELEGPDEAIRRVADRLGIDPERFDRRDYLQIWRDTGGSGDMTFAGEP